MAPPCQRFLASQLPFSVQRDVHGQRRKPDPAVGSVDLESCELLKMVQWNQREFTKFVAVERLFRRCKDRKGSFLVETTAWEKRDRGSQRGEAAQPRKLLQWSTSWLDD
ncbi:hypothetical protein GQ602_000902 [Ophiocordyceps camponoti-floridani]|uniref:Uncharacterized protein n=1 Tax=Ophiocordyceps camponoti-floridani TaxID=2030778 RepID=A0A8H4VGP2_9HYPO|nr:hypothetical protein GQ602_000902 [Ophiocordyceps camponoti-floridani]